MSVDAKSLSTLLAESAKLTKEARLVVSEPQASAYVHIPELKL